MRFISSIVLVLILQAGCSDGSDSLATLSVACGEDTAACREAKPVSADNAVTEDPLEGKSDGFAFNSSIGTTANETLQLTWNALDIDEAVKYQVTISSKEDCSSPIQVFNNLVEPQVTLDPLFADGVYYACLAAFFGSDEKLESPQNGKYQFKLQRAVKLVFAALPNAPVANAPFSPAMRIEARDANDQLATTFDKEVSVSFSLQGNPLAVLSGATQVKAQGGVAEFSNLKITTTGTFKLEANSEGLPAVASSTFVVGSNSNCFSASFVAGWNSSITWNDNDVTLKAMLPACATVHAAAKFGSAAVFSVNGHNFGAAVNTTNLNGVAGNNWSIQTAAYTFPGITFPSSYGPPAQVPTGALGVAMATGIGFRNFDMKVTGLTPGNQYYFYMPFFGWNDAGRSDNFIPSVGGTSFNQVMGTANSQVILRYGFTAPANGEFIMKKNVSGPVADGSTPHAFFVVRFEP
jgi:hypothetical protein